MPPPACGGHWVPTAPQPWGDQVAVSIPGEFVSPRVPEPWPRCPCTTGWGCHRKHTGEPRPGGDRGAQDTVLPRDAGVAQLPATGGGGQKEVEAPGGDDGMAGGGGWVLSTASPALQPHHLAPAPAAPSTARSRAVARSVREGSHRQRLSWLLELPKPHVPAERG